MRTGILLSGMQYFPLLNIARRLLVHGGGGDPERIPKDGR
jgi:hypothetical protein